MPGDRVVAIHQPNFFPWLGYFNKIARSDVFIVLDNVQFPKTGGNWMNRVRILVKGKPVWMSMPVVRAYHGVLPVAEMRIDDHTSWRARLVKTIQDSYRRAPYFETILPFLEELIHAPGDLLADFNMRALRALIKALGLDSTRVVLGSGLKLEGKGTDLLVAMVQAVGGTTYLCGGGQAGYQEDEKFAAAGLRLIHQHFEHPVYAQTNTTQFAAGLSIIDALMHCGFERTRAFVVESVLSQ